MFYKIRFPAVAGQFYPEDKKEFLSRETKVWFENLNDQTCEGIYHKNYPLLGVQFHPEANPGPNDTNWIFDLFLDYLRKNAR